MQINYTINYSTGLAITQGLTVIIKEVQEPTAQNFKGIVGIGFQKMKSKRFYQCYIVSISDALLEKNREDNKLLPNYASQLGDQFDELSYQREQINSLTTLLGKFPKKKEIAIFYEVTAGAVSQWSEETLETTATMMRLKQFGFSYNKK